ncbi:restin [Thecamonas trahens ATCC 50062]|uniref:Restin n=1 Tax=Thecamonas trahens ATCC 50062 TaxID=461836 RepID=A0A0L0DP42_THETB|nr:restin [Thecamonas trahens ATCC 50062]KNC54045.1 restin [Thecamonas trahens ATCC 50062]|eukprot:XP_013754056.1 restin [Thecamonas trahens ATCC 50062]
MTIPLSTGDRVFVAIAWPSWYSRPRWRLGPPAGTVRYCGAVRFDVDDALPGNPIWVGIELDEPIGNTNGVVRGVRYFDCHQTRGRLVPIRNVRRAPPGIPAPRARRVDVAHPTPTPEPAPEKSWDAAVPLRPKSRSPKRVIGSAALAAYPIGARVVVDAALPSAAAAGLNGHSTALIGSVVYCGSVSWAASTRDSVWVGVILDEPFGNTTGAVNGEVFFRCPKRYGRFVPASLLDADTAVDSGDEILLADEPYVLHRDATSTSSAVELVLASLVEGSVGIQLPTVDEARGVVAAAAAALSAGAGQLADLDPNEQVVLAASVLANAPVILSVQEGSSASVWFDAVAAELDATPPARVFFVPADRADSVGAGRLYALEAVEDVGGLRMVMARGHQEWQSPSAQWHSKAQAWSPQLRAVFRAPGLPDATTLRMTGRELASDGRSLLRVHTTGLEPTACAWRWPPRGRSHPGLLTVVSASSAFVRWRAPEACAIGAKVSWTVALAPTARPLERIMPCSGKRVLELWHTAEFRGLLRGTYMIIATAETAASEPALERQVSMVIDVVPEKAHALWGNDAVAATPTPLDCATGEPPPTGSLAVMLGRALVDAAAASGRIKIHGAGLVTRLLDYGEGVVVVCANPDDALGPVHVSWIVRLGIGVVVACHPCLAVSQLEGDVVEIGGSVPPGTRAFAVVEDGYEVGDHRVLVLDEWMSA